jgi:hypothetical protein
MHISLHDEHVSRLAQRQYGSQVSDSAPVYEKESFVRPEAGRRQLLRFPNGPLGMVQIVQTRNLGQIDRQQLPEYGGSGEQASSGFMPRHVKPGMLKPAVAYKRIQQRHVFRIHSKPSISHSSSYTIQETLQVKQKRPVPKWKTLKYGILFDLLAPAGRLGVHFIPYFVHSMNKKRIFGVQYIGLHHLRFAIVTDEFGTDHDPVWLRLIANDTWIR